MIPLDKDLQKPKKNFKEFGEISLRVLKYLPNVLSNSEIKNKYIEYSSDITGTKKYVRPINQNLFIANPKDFSDNFEKLQKIFKKIINHSEIKNTEKLLIDNTIYTIQQSIGAGLDLLVNPNSARKHVGNRFEELIKVIFTEIGVSNKRIVLQIPYETDEGTKTYKCENDLI